MSTDQNEQIVRRYLERYVSQGDEDVCNELVDEPIVFTSPYSPEPVRGRRPFKAMLASRTSA